jgi:hypothetical protein
MAVAYPGISRDCHATVVPGAFSKQKCRALIPKGVSDTLPKCQACFASVRQRRSCRQPGCFRPGNSCCGGARVKGLKVANVRNPESWKHVSGDRCGSISEPRRVDALSLQ